MSRRTRLTSGCCRDGWLIFSISCLIFITWLWIGAPIYFSSSILLLSLSFISCAGFLYAPLSLSVSEGVLRDIARGLSFFIYKYEHRNVEEISICTSWSPILESDDSFEPSARPMPLYFITITQHEIQIWTAALAVGESWPLWKPNGGPRLVDG